MWDSSDAIVGSKIYNFESFLQDDSASEDDVQAATKIISLWLAKCLSSTVVRRRCCKVEARFRLILWEKNTLIGMNIYTIMPLLHQEKLKGEKILLSMNSLRGCRIAKVR